MVSSTAEEREDNVPLAFGLTLIAGLATTIGSSSAFFSKLRNYGLLTRGLALAAGVMLFVSFCEILQVKAVDSFTESIGERYATMAAYGCFFAGIALTVLLDMLVHRIGHHHHSHDPDDAMANIEAGDPVPTRGLASDSDDEASGEADLEMQEPASAASAAAIVCKPALDAEEEDAKAAEDEDTGSAAGGHKQTVALGATGAGKRASAASSSTSALAATAAATTGGDEAEAAAAAPEGARPAGQTDKELGRMGLMTALAIAIHNFPEGLATFVATLDDPAVGAAIATAIAIHNIPEGVCVAMPVYYATGNRWKAFWWSFFSGVTEPVGALIGYFLLRSVFTETLFGVLFGLVSGMMCFIAFKELLPTARKYDPKDKIVTWYVVAGMFVMALSLVLFTI